MSILDTKEYISKIKSKSKIRDSIPAGIYEISLTPDDCLLSRKDIVSDEIIDIPGSESDFVIKEVNEFMKDTTKEKYKAYGMLYKKGILLHGKPGTGKSVTALLAARKLVEHKDAVVIYNPVPEHFKVALEIFKEELKNRLVCIVLEEFETMYEESSQLVLSLLDGDAQLENLITIACTNYIERLPERIKSRPSRFSTVLEVGPPNAEIRRIFISSKLQEHDKDKLEALVDSTEGFTIDQIKDVILSVCVYEQPLSEAILKIKAMQENSIGEENVRSHFTNNYIGDIRRELRNITGVLTRKK